MAAIWLNWQDRTQGLPHRRRGERLLFTCEDAVHHVETYTPSFILDDLKTAALALRERIANLLRRTTVQHVSGQWVEQYQRDSAKQGGPL